jgi:hypothetical protein
VFHSRLVHEDGEHSNFRAPRGATYGRNLRGDFWPSARGRSPVRGVSMNTWNLFRCLHAGDQQKDCENAREQYCESGAVLERAHKGVQTAST